MKAAKLAVKLRRVSVIVRNKHIKTCEGLRAKAG
jgi:hypothetical protein